MFRVLSRLLAPSSRARPRRRPALERLEDREVLTVAAEEQLFVYLLNRARHDPVAYQREANLPVDLSYVQPRPPLAVNDLLFSSANFKAEEMARHNYFNHRSPVTGIWPNKLVRDTGYALPSIFDPNNNYLESLAYGWQSGGGRNPTVATAGAVLRALIIDAGVPSLGHRNHLLGIGTWNAGFKEIGVGHATWDVGAAYDYWAVHTGYVSSSDVFLTGVVYNDLNGNRRYDLNEGLAGITIEVGGHTTTTNAAGGWSLKVTPGTYTVTASGGGYVGTSQAQVTVGSANVAVDFVSGRPGAQINFVDNEAPVLGAVPDLTPMREDTRTSGDPVSRLTVNTTDADPGALRGVAVVGSSGTGTWQFFNGTAWVNLGPVADDSARLLPAGYRLRFVPAANWFGQATLTLRAWDRTAGTVGGRVDLSDGSSVGGQTAFSANAATTNLEVTPVNDAPTQPGTRLTLPTASRQNADPPGIRVSDLLIGAADVDGDVLGIALIGLAGAGRWEVSTDGGANWLAIGPVSRGSALLLRPTDRVRFVPNGGGTGNASLTFVAWDQSKGNAGSRYALPLTLGGATPFSTAARTALLPLNDAPVLGAVPDLTPMREDTRTAGNLVSRLTAGVVDTDRGALRGVAVVGSSGTGTWQFFNGTAWVNLGPVADDSARLLPAGYRLRFVPAANWFGQATLTLRAWDRTAGTVGGRVDLSDGSSVGGQTAFSANAATTNLEVTPVNDAPTQPGTRLTLPTASRQNADPPGTRVSDLLIGAADVDGDVLGIALIGLAGAGRWEVSTDGGANWLAIGPVSRGSALLLRPTDHVRFVPNGGGTGNASLTFVAWDQSKGNAGSRYALPLTLGGATPLSTAARTALLPLE